jgi:hypothetical protein
MKKHVPTDWRGKMLAKIRRLIKQADTKVVEEIKYRTKSNRAGVPVWYHDGMICTGETYKEHLRFTFSKGKRLKDPKGVLNRHTAIVITKDDRLNETAFKALIKEAVVLNGSTKGRPKKRE